MRFSTSILLALAAGTPSASGLAFQGSSVRHSARAATRSRSALEMKYRVAVVGGGPSGACAAEIFAQEKNVETVLFERKLDNAKPCGRRIRFARDGR